MNKENIKNTDFFHPSLRYIFSRGGRTQMSTLFLLNLFYILYIFASFFTKRQENVMGLKETFHNTSERYTRRTSDLNLLLRGFSLKSYSVI